MNKILIIDDSIVQADSLRTILQDEYEISVAHTAEEGFRSAVSGQYSLILLDVIMPGMDGFTLLKALQEDMSTRRVPVILITSLTDVEHEVQGLIMGAVDYIAKPFHPLVVKARVNTHTKLYSYRKQIEKQALADELTGLSNRRHYDKQSLRKWNDAIRLQIPFSVCMFDIDRFKLYNDTYGHPAGDKVISSVAKTLSANFQRTTDFVARYGGEEFVAIISGGSAKSSYEHLRKIRRSIENIHIPHSPPEMPWVTVSIGGITVKPKTGDTYQTYLKIADTMLYDAKRFGRNRVIWCNENMEQWRER